MYRMIPSGKIVTKSAAEVKCSRLGLGFEKLDRDAFNPENAYEKVAQIGVKWIRIQSGWQKTEKVKGVYDFGWLDKIVDRLLSLGLKPWICVCYGNALYGGMAEEIFGAVGCPPIHTEEQRAAWHNYCVALAEHYRGRVEHMELWNEGDGTHCWKHGRNATEFGNFQIATAKALREGNPDCYIIGGALAGVDMVFLNEAFKTGMADYIDALSFHAYTYDDRKVKHQIRALRALLNQYRPEIELIQGESGAQSRAGGHGALWEGGWTPRKQSKYLLRRLVGELGMGTKFSSYFSCIDMMEALNGKVGDKGSYQDFGYFGVLGAEFDENGVATGEYPPKPSYYALSYLASLLEGEVKTCELPILVEGDIAPHCGNIPTLEAHEIDSYGFRLDNGSYAFAYFHPSNAMTTDYEGALTLRATDLGEAHLVDPMDGTIYEFTSNMLIKDDFGGMIFKRIPVRDYPLFIIFGEIK